MVDELEPTCRKIPFIILIKEYVDTNIFICYLWIFWMFTKDCQNKTWLIIWSQDIHHSLYYCRKSHKPNLHFKNCISVYALLLAKHIYVYWLLTNTKFTISNKVRLTCWHGYKKCYSLGTINQSYTFKIIYSIEFYMPSNNKANSNQDVRHFYSDENRTCSLCNN